MSKRNVVLAMATYRHVDPTVFRHMVGLLQHSFFEIHSVIVLEGMSISVARNKLAVYAMDHAKALESVVPEAEWVCFIDDDMQVPPDLIERLRECAEAENFDVLSAVYYERGTHSAVVYVENPETGELQKPPNPHPTAGVSVIDACGFGAVIIRIGALRAMRAMFGGNLFEYLANSKEIISEDISFCEKARNAGLRLGVRWDTTCGHTMTSALNKETYEALFRSQPEESSLIKVVG